MRKIFTSLLLVSSISAACAAGTTSSTALPSIVEMQTNVGTVTIQLNHDKAPISSKNFLDYVNSGFYKDTFFHRVYNVYDPKDNTKLLIKVVQGGGFDANTSQLKTNGLLSPIVNEANNGLHNSISTIAMARTSDPNSATSQFFFNLTDNSSNFDFSGSANPGYAVFGDIVGGMDIVNKIGNYGTIKTAYSEGVPFSEINDCGFNFCMKKVIVETVYTSDILDTLNSWTRVIVNGNGKVTSIPSGISCSLTSKKCTLRKSVGTAVKLVAKPSTGYEFKGWSGDCQNTDITKPLTIDTKTGNHNCTATFAKIQG